MTTNNNFVIKNILVIVITFYKTKKVSKSCLMSIIIKNCQKEYMLKNDVG